MHLRKIFKITLLLVVSIQFVNYGTTDSLAIRTLLLQSNKVQNELIIDFSKSKENFNPVISISGGTGDNIMKSSEFWSSLGNKFKDLNPSLMRINIFDVLYQSPQWDSMNWGKLDIAINNIKSLGAKPFITLFPMPEGRWTNIPQYDDDVWWEHYKQICKEIAMHLSSPTGLNLSGLYYEVWNEPDYDHFWQANPIDAGIKWKLFNKMYKSACNGILAGDPNAKIGGPTAALPAAINSFLEYYKKDPSQLNFISWHWYNGDFQYSNYTKKVAVDALIAFNIPHANMEYIISEYNLNGNFDPMNDQFFNAGNLAKTQDFFRVDSKLQGLFFLPRDFNNDSGGFGAFTSPGDHRYPPGNLPKPSYNFFKLYSQMAGTEVSVINRQSKIKAWASKTNSGYSILLWSFLPTNTFGIKLDTKITIQKIPSGKYLQRNYLIDSKNGYFLYDLSNNILPAGVLKPVEKNITINGNYHLNYKLENGGVELIEFVPNN